MGSYCSVKNDLADIDTLEVSITRRAHEVLSCGQRDQLECQ